MATSEDKCGGGPAAPRTMAATFHLTHRCNLRCTYCYTGEKDRAHMLPATAARAVEFVSEEGRRQGADQLEIVFFGGEPLLRAELLLGICRQFREVWPDRLTFRLSTNGTLLSETLLQQLLNARVFVSISIDGPPDIQASQRPGAQGHDWTPEVLENVHRLLEYNPCTNVNAVITPATAGRIDEIVAWLYGQGFAYISTALDYGADWTRHDLSRLGAAYKRLAGWYRAQTLAGKKFYLSCFDERIRTWARGPIGQCERCSLGYRQFSIAPSGNLYPCVQFVREDEDHTCLLGNVETGFDEGRRHALHERAEAAKPECSGCAIQPRCTSWCACVNWQTTGNIDQASPLVCEHERLLMPIVDSVANQLWRKRDKLFLHKQYNPAFPLFSFVEDVVLRETSHARQEATQR